MAPSGPLRLLLIVGTLAVATATCGSSELAHLCVEDTEYPRQTSSPFVLPFGSGAAFLVGLGNCVTPGTGSHAKGSRAEFAYDLVMPVGTELLAAAAGVVLLLEERFADGTGVAGEENTLLVQHADGTVSNYGHIAAMGVLVDEGEAVVQGQVVAISGNSGGSSEPHLHFEVLRCRGAVLTFEPVVSLASRCRSLPVTFRNTRAHPLGLLQGESYEALPLD